MSNPSTPSPEDNENYDQDMEKLKEKFSTLTHDKKHKESFRRDEELKQPDIKPEETKEE